MAVHHHSEQLTNVTKKSEWTSLISLSVIMVALCLTFPLVSTYLIEPFLMDMYHQYVPNLIGTGNLYIMIMMLCTILILPIAVRVLTLGKKISWLCPTWAVRMPVMTETSRIPSEKKSTCTWLTGICPIISGKTSFFCHPWCWLRER